jgi:hypothetical protein
MRTVLRNCLLVTLGIVIGAFGYSKIFVQNPSPAKLGGEAAVDMIHLGNDLNLHLRSAEAIVDGRAAQALKALNMSIDSDLLTLYFAQGKGYSSAYAKRTLARAIEFRKNHPFEIPDDSNYSDVSSFVRKIVTETSH